MLLAVVGVLLVGWLLEQLANFNAFAALFVLALGGNIISWFASYKWGASKWFFPLSMIVSILFFVVFFS